MRIHDLAAKYGLNNNVKVQQLQLIQVDNGDQSQAGGKKSDLQGSDKKDRIAEYHARVNEKRKRMHAKQVIKKKEQEALEASVLQKNSTVKGMTRGGGHTNSQDSQVNDPGQGFDDLEEERVRQETGKKQKKPKRNV